MRDPDWFLRWFMYLIFAAVAVVCLMMAQVYAKTSTWDDWLKEDTFGSDFLYYDQTIFSNE